jgi:bZIP transcription factor
MEHHVHDVGDLSHTEEALDWLQPEYQVAMSTGLQPGMVQEAELASQLYPLDPSLQQQQSEPFDSLHGQALPMQSTPFAWSDLSPRSVNDPQTANVLPLAAGPTSNSSTSKGFKQDPRLAPMPTFAAVSAAAPMSGYGGLEFVHPAYLMAPGMTGTHIGASIPGPFPQSATPGPPPPLAGKAKRGRGAARKAAKPKGGQPSFQTNAGETKSEAHTPRPVSGRPRVAISTEEKRRVRAERNRESAEKSRLRRKKYTEDLEKEVGSLRETNRSLKTRTEDLLAMLQSVDADVEQSVSRGDGSVAHPPNGGAALKAALLALENVKQQCPITFADSTVRVEIGSSAGKRK